MTKRGRITFATSKVMMEESLTGYFRNSFEGFWERGGFNEKFFLLTMTGILSFSASFIGLAFFTAPLQAQIRAASIILAIALAVMIYEHWNNVERDKFIEYSDIDSVKLVEGVRPLTCPRFIINYTVDDEQKMRYVTMPVTYMPGVEKDIESISEAFGEKDVKVVRE